MIKNASIYRKENKYVIHAYSITSMGLSISSEPYFILEDNSSIEKICECINSALNQSKIGVEHPTDWKKQVKILFENMQEKSIKTLHSNNAITCDITEEKGKISLYPMANLGAKLGFNIIPNLVINIPKEELQNNILKALDLCT